MSGTQKALNSDEHPQYNKEVRTILLYLKIRKTIDFLINMTDR